MSNNTGNTIIALLTGATIGAGLGLLYAPKSGKETRKDLKDGANDLKDSLSSQYDDISHQLADFTNRTKNDIEKRLEHTFNSTNQKADDMLSKLQAELDELKKKNEKLQKELKSATK
ncbi:YtxH domain-containing protein [Psychroflexus sp. ALD_RP9]|uniref:YtxH domain-containing protein n=1 Tax=Psychroflexus sp. ALD_RP9 TaxID=2777186 RepID=UPI001A8FB8CC|nr:YtxH domain-containing protein [Psychroflexus sp. ALD_RP9]QSS98122.1 YtxH domain-containing protein [Psychroflexus sp. ALD_RP9]